VAPPGCLMVFHPMCGCQSVRGAGLMGPGCGWVRFRRLMGQCEKPGNSAIPALVDQLTHFPNLRALSVEYRNFR
jgi:hypothetical protein